MTGNRHDDQARDAAPRTWRRLLFAWSVAFSLFACRDSGTAPANSRQSVSVDVSGLPSGVSAAITLTPPSGAPYFLEGSNTVGNAPSGQWRLVARPVSSSSSTWVPARDTIDSTLVSGATLRYSVQYERTGHAFTALITGLPPNAPASITVTGPDAVSRAVSRDTILLALDSGTYTVRADTVTVSGFKYAPAPRYHFVPVSASLSTVSIKVTYERALPVLDVYVTGLPPSTASMFRIADAGGTRAVAGANAQSITAQPGAVSIAALPTMDALGHAYVAAPATVTRSLVDGIRDSVELRYVRTKGTLLVNVGGLPQGTEGALTISGGAYSSAVTGLSTLELDGGTYTMRAVPVMVGSTRYTPTPASVALSVANGITTTANVLYSAGTPPAFNVAVDGAYLTQVVQQSDGSLPLIAGRDALLRVFAHANYSSSARAGGRARFYDGATLVATEVLPSPLSVPTSIVEGSLASSWNVRVPASRIKPGLRVLVEIDPDSTLGEKDRSDNRWPTTGIPATVDVHVAPPFAVRFVPIVISAIPGIVTAEGRDQFFTLARRLHPLLDISSDLHAPFVSSVKNPLVVDGITLWGFLLSELNAVRTAEGGTANYFGVVNTAYAKGIAGIALTGGPVALGYDLPSRLALTAAHEWGHNFGRMHAPCGNPSQPDLHFPHPGGITGSWGWNALTNELVSPRSTDLMGYCEDVWMSDWTWKNEVEFRERAAASARALRSSTNAGEESHEGLLVWGRTLDGQVTIEPAFRVPTAAAETAQATSKPVAQSISPLATAALGNYRVVVTDGSGSVIASAPVDALPVDDVPGHDLRTFAIVIPWSDALDARAVTIEVHDGNSLPIATRQSDTGNTHHEARAMMRDPVSGQIVGFIDADQMITMSGTRHVEFTVSDGVHSRRLRMP